MRSRTCKAFKSRNVEKLNNTIESVGCSQSFFKRWILHQLYGDLIEEIYGCVWTNDHCYLLSRTNLSDKIEMNESTYWIILRPVYCNGKIPKGDKIDHRLYLMHEVKAIFFKKIK